ncbi:MAG: sulfatase family protein [Marinilabiliaceae bacterium]
MKYTFFLPTIAAGMLAGCSAVSAEKKHPGNEKDPNVILIYTDDVGYGDLSCYGGEIPTPNIDALANSGLMLTNAYATAATCTPSRFSLLTGEYAWREPGRGVLEGDAPAIIDPARETLPKVMKRAGYRTGIVGKWHLGLGGEGGPDWNGKVAPGPLETGFDYSFLLPATGDRVPCVYLENHHVVDLDPDDPIKVSFSKNIGDRPTGLEHPEKLKQMWSHGHNHTIINGISRIGYMKGGEDALWRDEDMADVFIDKAVDFINDPEDSPFFLFFSTHDIHVPRVPHERFQGSTGYGPRGDAIAQLDWSVGKLMKTLEEKEMKENTLVIFTSDNGPVLDDGYEDNAAEKLGLHTPAANLRGGKYSAYEAGTKVPMIVQWPAKLTEGGQSDALFSQVDMLASFASLLGVDFNQYDAIDSHNHWDVLIGKEKEGSDVIIQSAFREVLSCVNNEGMKYTEPSDGPQTVPWGVYNETGFDTKPQLYNLNKDPQEVINIAGDHPEIAGKMEAKLDSIKVIR